MTPIIHIGTIESSNSTEQDFMQAVYDTLLGLDTYGITVTCDTTPALQYAETSNIPTFNFTFSSGLVLQLVRNTNLTNSANIFKTSIYVNEDAKVLNTQLIYRSAGAKPSTIYTRNISFCYVITDFGFYFWFGDYNNTELSGSKVVFSYLIDDDEVAYGGGYAGSNATLIPYYELGEGTTGCTANIYFNYDASPGYLEYCASATFCNTGAAQFTIEDIVSSSTVAVGHSYYINQSSYFAVGTHTLVEIG